MVPKFDKLDEPFESIAEDDTILPVALKSGPISSVRAIIVDDRDSERTLLKVPASEAVEDDLELENVDATRVYTESEWGLIKSLLALL